MNSKMFIGFVIRIATLITNRNATKETLKETIIGLRRSRKTLSNGPIRFCFKSKERNFEIICGIEALKMCEKFSPKARGSIVQQSENIQDLLLYLKNMRTHISILKRAKEDFDYNFGLEQNRIDNLYNLIYRNRILKVLHNCELQKNPDSKELEEVREALAMELVLCKEAYYKSPLVRSKNFIKAMNIRTQYLARNNNVRLIGHLESRSSH